MGYQYLREQYPEIITKDQLYRICHISKRKALWLLENGVIPCEDSGKKTRRFRIRLEDVIEFLERRDVGDLDVIHPQGIFSSYSHPVCQPRTYLDREELCAFILTKWNDQPDMLTVREVAELCGYSAHTVSGWVRKGTVASVAYHGANLVFKESLAEWLASGEGPGIRHMSEVHRRLVEGFQIGTWRGVPYSFFPGFGRIICVSVVRQKTQSHKIVHKSS